MNGDSFLRRFRNMLRALETPQEKAFWLSCLLGVLLGLLSLFAARFFSLPVLSYVCGALFLLCSACFTALGFRTRNYRLLHPVSCFVTGILLLPLTFLSFGSLSSGILIFCTAGTGVCCFCYEKKWRWLSFLLSLLSMSAALYLTGTGRTLSFFYLFTSVLLFVSLNAILSKTSDQAAGYEVLENFMDKNIRKVLIRKVHHGELQQAGHPLDATVLFVDISHFTTISESLSPEKTAEFLNEFLTVADRCIHENNGILDKFIGDCAMAYWPNFGGDYSGIRDAVQTVFDMESLLAEKQASVRERFHYPLVFSAGIACGDVIEGSIGAERQKDYTIIGDTVNTASRIQGYAGPGELLISEKAFLLAGDSVIGEPAAEDILLRGRQGAISLYRVTGLTHFRLRDYASDQFSR